MHNISKTHWVLPNNVLGEALSADEQSQFHSLLRKIERHCKADGQEQACIIIDESMPEYEAVAHAIASREKGQQQLLNHEVDQMAYELDVAYDRGLNFARAGVQTLHAGLEDSAYADCPDAWYEKPFARIVWQELSGDSSVGIQRVSGWVLAPDQTNTVLQDLAHAEKERA
jgi:hypothetical protein